MFGHGTATVRLYININACSDNVRTWNSHVLVIYKWTFKRKRKEDNSRSKSGTIGLVVEEKIKKERKGKT